MVKFAKFISERWNIPETLSTILCTSYEDGDSPFYVAEYNPVLAAESDLMQVQEVFDFLQTMEELGPKKTRLINALKKAERFTEADKRRIEMTFNGNELDDMLISLRPNPRSKAQMALKKGLGELAAVIEKQETTTPVEDLAAACVGKDPSLKSAADVISGVKDILAERIAYDETVRAMAREFCYEDGFFEVIPKDGKDPRFAQYRNKNVPVKDLAPQELLTLFVAEDEKQARCKLGVQLFRITEVLRHHFITNPDTSAFDTICETIDDSWQRLLLPIVERDVKVRLRREAEDKLLKQMAVDMGREFSKEREGGPFVSVCMDDAGQTAFIAIGRDGRLVGASTEKQNLKDAPSSSDRIRKFLVRYRPTHVIVCDDARAPRLEELLVKNAELREGKPEFTLVRHGASPAVLADSEWMKKNYADLDALMHTAFALGLGYVRPLTVVAQAGVAGFDVHPLQKLVSAPRFGEVLHRVAVQRALHEGIPVRNVGDSVLRQFRGVTPELLSEIRNTDVKTPFKSKFDMRSVKGMNEVVFRNIAGYIVLGQSDNPLDMTLVHPYFYEWLEEICDDIGTSIEGIVVNPNLLHAYTRGDFARNLYVQRNLLEQLSIAPKMAASGSPHLRRRLKLAEIQEGQVVSGRVTNITPFGVFVNINAVCDGLIHISQLADAYVESAEQVVTVGDRVNVRVINVDIKKRRISLSMKGMGNSGPKVKASKGQIDTLLEHFSKK